MPDATTATLDAATLRALTGYRQPTRMARWLSEHGWVFERPAGRGALPAVDRTYYLARMSGRDRAAPPSRLRLDRM